ncbi:hypothetical protein MTES_0240 [Microbacterium testaceum StLB037]|uniref:Uncharacterized protein n=1 Tax=Microbacterium testaceum (strain StLB037) TaxID=979556 RepID=E8N8Z5_MICTS|nr:hypothetical protein [Microbacterium testaceum]BAJ73204.1 hypothetical protein MTES_0240 [Microbacterium testaceum StLB037]
MTTHAPRTVTSVLSEVGIDSVSVTWGLGEPVHANDVEFFGYGVYYYDPTGNGGKRLGVRFGDATTAWVFDNASATQANYAASAVTATNEAVTAHFHDASLGLEAVGTIEAYAHVNGHDTQVDLPVTLLR